MSTFEVGQKWKTRSGEIVTILDCKILVECRDGEDIIATEDLIEQVVEPKYRPFATAAEFDAYRDKWVLSKTGNNRCRVNSYNDQRVGVSPDWLFWSVAFESYTFEDGRPFGIEVTS